MDDFLFVLTDILIIVFDLTVYCMMFALKRDTLLYRLLMFGGCLVIIGAYFGTVYFLHWPASLASAACMSVPSFFLFLALSRYKGSRFLLTFCFVDTITLIIAFIGRYVGLLVPNGAVGAFLTVLILCGASLLIGHKYFKRYHQLMDVANAGWTTMAAATVLIYFALIFFSAYPKPMVERVEYAPTWLVFALVVLACYAVFIQSILKTKRILEQNSRLEEEQHLFHLVYVDALTGLYNRAAFVEQMNQMERDGSPQNICCIMMDCNQFKRINDSYGHQIGDDALKRIAAAIQQAFSKQTDSLFRIGGDEFAVILKDTSADAVEQGIALLRQGLREEGAALKLPLSIAVGFVFVSSGETIENAFIRADRKMYEDKQGNGQE